MDTCAIDKALLFAFFAKSIQAEHTYPIVPVEYLMDLEQPHELGEDEGQTRS